MNVEWKKSTYGSDQTLDLGFFNVSVIYRSGSQESPTPESERYEFRINGKASKKKFASSEEAKRVALQSALNYLQAATETVKSMIHG